METEQQDKREQVLEELAEAYGPVISTVSWEEAWHRAQMNEAFNNRLSADFEFVRANWARIKEVAVAKQLEKESTE